MGKLSSGAYDMSICPSEEFKLALDYDIDIFYKIALSRGDLLNSGVMDN